MPDTLGLKLPSEVFIERVYVWFLKRIIWVFKKTKIFKESMLK